MVIWHTPQGTLVTDHSTCILSKQRSKTRPPFDRDKVCNTLGHNNTATMAYVPQAPTTGTDRQNPDFKVSHSQFQMLRAIVYT